MTGTVNFGFWMDNVNGVTISDMTIRNISQHGVIANSGVDNPTFRNLRITDIGDQFLKNNPTAGQGVDNGILENSILEYTSYAPDTYTNGLDVHFGKNWVVRGNTFKNFRSTSGLVGPAVLFWNGSSDTVVERNTFINNHRDISFGLDNTKTAQAPVSNGTLTDHARGVIANNFIYRSGGQSFFDVPIAVFDSPSTKVYNNTVFGSGLYPNAVEYRFPRTTGVDIKNNLTDGQFTALAVGAHEIPQEIGDFAVMLKKGMSSKKVLGFNIASAFVSLVGAVLTFYFGSTLEGFLPIFISITAGFFIYISASDLIPEIHEKNKRGFALFETVMIFLGVISIYILITLLEH
jgi:hypothetical protein